MFEQLGHQKYAAQLAKHGPTFLFDLQEVPPGTLPMLVRELSAALKAVNLACRLGRSLQAGIVAGKQVRIWQLQHAVATV